MINKIDYKIAEFFHKIYLWGGQFTNKGMEVISLVAEAGILFLIIGFVLALFKRTRKIGGTILLSVAIGFVITNVILKPIIARARPFSGLGTDYYKWWLDAGSARESGYSFPSGHTTATTAFAVAIFLTTNKNRSWPILFLPFVMASSRIYLMVHYFSDCMGAIAVGTTAAVIAWLVMLFVYKSKIKFFVWARELVVFKPYNKNKSKLVEDKSIQTDKEVGTPQADYVYTSQADEQSTKNTLESTAENKNE